MFEYVELSSRKTLVINLGKYVSHSIVYIKGENGLWGLRPIDEINNLNRFKLAEYFYYEKKFDGYYMSNEDVERVGKSRIIRDIAFWVDERIPKSYYKWKYGRHDSSPARMRGIKADELGLIYQFKENSSGVHKQYTDYAYATDKQKRYIEYLVSTACYSVKTLDNMTMREAGQVIDFLLRNTLNKPDCFSRYIGTTLKSIDYTGCDQSVPATYNQRSDIETLVKETGYIVKTFEGMTIEEASLIISFLLDEISDTPSCFFKYIEY